MRKFSDLIEYYSESLNKKQIGDHEEDYLSFKKTWYDNIKNKSSSEKMLTRPKKNKFDSTKEKQRGYKKKDLITVWGAPRDFNYIRG